MKFSLLLPTFLAATVTASGSQASAPYAQVNFYYDTECKDYAGHAFPNPVHGAVGSTIPKANIVGGPAGSKSMLFVYANCDCNDCSGTYPALCKNKECTSIGASYGNWGECRSYENGVWAAYWEECPLD